MKLSGPANDRIGWTPDKADASIYFDKAFAHRLANRHGWQVEQV